MAEKRRMRRALAGGAGMGLAVALAACGSGSVAPPSPRTAILTAYRASMAAKTARFTLTEGISMSVAGSVHSETIRATGETDFATNALAMRMSAGSLGGTVRIVERSPNLYMQLPASLRSEIPGHKSWLSVDIDELLSSKLGASFSQLSQLEQSGPTEELSELQAVSSHVTRVGSRRVAGVATTEYRGKLVWSKVIARLRELVGAKVVSAMAKLGRTAHITTLPFEVWVDSYGRLARFTTSMPFALGTTSGEVSITMDMSDYGVPVHIVAPPASEVENLTSLLSGSGGA